jgi:hypothetical protein
MNRSKSYWSVSGGSHERFPRQSTGPVEHVQAVDVHDRDDANFTSGQAQQAKVTIDLIVEIRHTSDLLGITLFDVP